MGYLPLIQKDSVSHIHGLAVYVKKGLPFAKDLSLENITDFYFTEYPSFFPSVSHLLHLYAQILILFHLS